MTATGLPVTSAQTSAARAQLQLEEALGDRARAGHHLDQVVHGGLGGLRPVLLGEQRGRQLRLLQLVALLGEQRAQRDPGRRGDPAVRPGRGLGRQPVPLQPAQRALGVRLRQGEPAREVGEVGGAHRHQRPVRRFLCLVQTYR